jgi:hypothetical protein
MDAVLLNAFLPGAGTNRSAGDWPSIGLETRAVQAIEQVA